MHIRFPFLPLFIAFSSLSLALTGGCGGRFSGPPGPAGMTLTAPVTELDAGAETQAAVEVTDFSGRVMNDAPVTWESSDAEVVSVVPATGGARLVAGRKAGPATITARAGTQVATILLTVRGAGPPVLSFAQDIQPIFTRSCALPDCHGEPEETAGEGLLLTPGASYEQTVGRRAVQVRGGTVMRIEPGQPDRSYLVAKIRGTHRDLGGRGSRMPLDGTLPEEDLTKILRWVENGAANN